MKAKRMSLPSNTFCSNSEPKLQAKILVTMIYYQEQLRLPLLHQSAILKSKSPASNAGGGYTAKYFFFLINCANLKRVIKMYHLSIPCKSKASQNDNLIEWFLIFFSRFASLLIWFSII